MNATAEFNERAAIVEWFETDFKEQAKATTKTSRIDGGKLSYTFSVDNDSGFDFDKFSFRIKVINKADNSEIGTAKINAGKWRNGERKSFKSTLAIPPDARSLSFIMYSNSLDFEATPYDGAATLLQSADEAMDDIGNVVRGFGDALSGADGSGGVFGELFGTGGMPETQGRTGTTVRNTSQTGTGSTKGNVSSTRTTGTSSPTRGRTATGNTVNTGNTSRQTVSPGQTFVQRRNEKKLNKKRLGRSGWTVAALVLGVVFVMAAAGATTPSAMASYGVIGIASLITAGVIKIINSNKAKRIRAYEARINKNGNTSIDDLAAAVGRPYQKVADDLQQMIVDGFFGEAYIDLDNRMLVMTRNGVPIEDVEKSAAQNKAAKRKAARAKGVEPESLDDLIMMTDDAEIKAKLKKLRSITMQIDKRVKEVPELEKQVRDFREKYYPEVVRLTDDYNQKIADMGSYSDKSKAEVTESASGAPVINTNPNYLDEQAAEIKEQLISLIDSVTEASENLLERLHEDDIMDITTDIKTLQTTLANKGLLDSDFDIK